MDIQYDRYVILAIIIVLLLWTYTGMKRWLDGPSFSITRTIELNEHIEDHPAISWLESEGYTIISGKIKIPLTFQCDDQRYYSRLFIDYIVTQNAQTYVVKVSRRRQPIDWSGAGLRDQLLCYMLFYPQCTGLLYVDMEQRRISCISLLKEEAYDVDEA